MVVAKGLAGHRCRSLGVHPHKHTFHRDRAPRRKSHIALLEEPIDWWLITRTISGETANSVAFDAILAAEERLRKLGRTDIRYAYMAIVEGTWWVAALEEQLRKGLRQYRSSLVADYDTARNDDEDGQYLRAFLWARNRHAHQLPFTTAFDAALAQRRGNVPSKFSEELVWEASDKLPPVDKGYEDETRQAIYDDLLAGHPINATLYHCALWFKKVAGRDLEWERVQAEKVRDRG